MSSSNARRPSPPWWECVLSGCSHGAPCATQPLFEPYMFCFGPGHGRSRAAHVSRENPRVKGWSHPPALSPVERALRMVRKPLIRARCGVVYGVRVEMVPLAGPQFAADGFAAHRSRWPGRARDRSPPKLRLRCVTHGSSRNQSTGADSQPSAGPCTARRCPAHGERPEDDLLGGRRSSLACTGTPDAHGRRLAAHAKGRRPQRTPAGGESGNRETGRANRRRERDAEATRGTRKQCEKR
jgi:hypothetical protein